MAMDSCSATPTGIPVVVLQAALAALVQQESLPFICRGLRFLHLMLVNRCGKFPFAQIGFIVPLHVNEFLAF